MTIGGLNVKADINPTENYVANNASYTTDVQSASNGGGKLLASKTGTSSLIFTNRRNDGSGSGSSQSHSAPNYGSSTQGGNTIPAGVFSYKFYVYYIGNNTVEYRFYVINSSIPMGVNLDVIMNGVKLDSYRQTGGSISYDKTFLAGGKGNYVGVLRGYVFPVSPYAALNEFTATCSYTIR
ncbi:hypothetical protein [Companilactobacillus mishanensis]|uniref:Uncharacterized protein n=1 Tax=Companilactobacillus mishanensis TaxID=2486008 RepID=A0ABW9P4V1_9LACO|nr:hypothetical protein [Companilactobacillus mishanensis]MQS44219.1 hypothetical protein [Companilactobacillus mishanensis]